ncbi:MAG TPA: bifunctional hydroxymethylpyrimidine kinase/phosphomethylpyrimidine kinase [Rhizomicrobium sp.]|nr:bifunctional hydroxymethylpyrimidine kinase/phosphomethylpyrimidine kinase [Rhizomicrobium sp.]
MSSLPRLLIIAGSDSGGGAGIQADIKTASAFGVYAMTAITAVTVQNTLGVSGWHPVPPETVRGQIEACLSDIGADAIKTGMLGDAAMIETVAASLRDHAAGIPLVLDPVMVAKGGAKLLADDAVNAIRTKLLPLATLVTPNLPECEALIGFAPGSDAEAREAGRKFHALGARHVLFKGGHASGSVVRDILADGETGALIVLEASRIETRHTHGTGCTLASAIASGLAQKRPLEEAVRRAHTYVQEAIRTAPGLGQGHGPLNHFVKPQ